MRILVSRTDRIGDVVLTLPLCGLLRTELGAEVVVLGRGYTRPVLEASPHVAEVLDWDDVALAGPRAQRDFLGAARVDVILHAFPRPDIARAARAAGIATRIGTSHRLYHWLTCNAPEHFSRRHSPLHESQLNVRLARRLLGEPIPTSDALAHLTRLEPREPLPAAVTDLLDSRRSQLVLHPLTGGSAREWPLAHWRELAESLDPSRVQVVVTGSVSERELLAGWMRTMPAHTTDLTGQLSVGQLVSLYARVDGVVAASTGPLHIAAAAGANTLGLFSPTAPVHPGRWAPMGPRASYMTPAVSCDSCRGLRGATDSCTCLDAITVSDVHDRIAGWLGGVRHPDVVAMPGSALPTAATI